jgi:hypothetical protein
MLRVLSRDATEHCSESGLGADQRRERRLPLTPGAEICGRVSSRRAVADQAQPTTEVPDIAWAPNELLFAMDFIGTSQVELEIRRLLRLVNSLSRESSKNRAELHPARARTTDGLANAPGKR